MEVLIPDIYENIFLRLDVRNLIRCKSVCKSWNSLISESQPIFKAHLCWYNIFLRLDVTNIIRCKSVCKSWKSLISESHFIKAQFNHSYTNNEGKHKRIGEAVFPSSDDYGYLTVGSSCGLVCFSAGHELLVANPLTREVRAVPKPSSHVKYFPRPNPRKDGKSTKDFSSCWGFGYDSLGDDFKVVLGVMKGRDQTYFQVFSLKSNAWHVIGEVDYISTLWQHQVLCNGAIHWVVTPKNQKRKQVILSFDLYKEEFTEISHPDDVRYQTQYILILGIMEECLCVRSRKAWVMRKDDENHSWLMVDNCKIEYEYIEQIWEVTDDPESWDGYLWFIGGNRKFKGDPRIMESLVSPHLQAKNE